MEQHWSVYYNAGIEYKDAKDFEASLAAHLKVLELEPSLDMPEAYHNIGAAYLRLNQRENAIPYLEQAVTYYDRLIQIIRIEETENARFSADFESQMNYLEEEEEEDEQDEDEDELDDFSLEDLGLPNQFFTPTNDTDFESIPTEENGFTEDEREVLPSYYENESVAYYIFWKACAQALLRDFDAAIATLEQCFEEDAYYAVEAHTEEDLTELLKMESFQKYLTPIVEKVKRPNHSHLFEMYEEIESQVLFGFEHPEECILDLLDGFEDRKFNEPVPTAWVRMTYMDLYKKQLEKQITWPEPTDVYRLGTTFKSLWNDGIVGFHAAGFSSDDAVKNTLKFIDDCIHDEKLLGYVCYDKDQLEDLMRRESGDLVLRFGSMRADVLFDAKVSQIIQKQVVENGLSVNLSKSTRDTLVISNFSWKKVYKDDTDQQLWDYWHFFYFQDEDDFEE